MSAVPRRIATAGTWQPGTGSKRIVDLVRMPPMPCGSNVNTGRPRRARSPLVSTNRSGLVVALTTAPPKWMITLASHPDLPLRERPMIRMFSWIVCQSRCR